MALSCVMDAIPDGERTVHVERIRRLFSDPAVHRTRLPDGFSFTFPVDPLVEIARFLANERRCCPFLDFTLRLAARTEGVQLVVTGPDGTREFLEAELGA